MAAKRKMAAERALRTLLVDASFVGAHWYGTLLAVVARKGTAPDGRPYDVVYGELYLAIESRFALFDALPAALPNHAEELPDPPFHERVSTIARLAKQRIANVSLGEHHPHLILTFASGHVFFLAGDDEEFESWNIQTSGVTGGNWTIVATPGSDLAILRSCDLRSRPDDLLHLTSRVAPYPELPEPEPGTPWLSCSISRDGDRHP